MKMKTKLTNRILSLVLAFVMVMGMLPMSSFTALAADTPTVKNIMLGASHIKGTQASNVYFGQYQQSSDGNGNYNFEPIKWRVLSNADGKLFLLSDQNLDVFEYHKEKESVTWETSTIRSWLNGYAASSNIGGDSGMDYTSNNFLYTAFSVKEQGAILDTMVVNNDNPNYETEGGNNTYDRVFLLSIAEAENTSYFADDNSRIATNTAYVAGGGEISTIGMNSVGEADYWWLRSPGCHDYCAARVNSGGVYSYGFVDKDIHAVRPAFNLNLNSVLFTSAANGGKPQGFRAVEEYTGNEYKLTLLDSRRNFAVSDTTAKTVKTGDTLSLGYTGATTDADEYISAMIADENDEILYYGTLASVTSNSGTVEFTVPSDLAAGTYTLKLLNEQINGDYKTDYASDFVDIALTVIPTATVSFNANGGTGSMGSVNVTDGAEYTLPDNPFTAPSGYQFKGWATSADGDVITTETITVTADTTLYAQWTPIYWTDEGNYDLSWYNDPNAYLYTISDGADLAGLAVLVNGMHGQTATTFAGKTITIDAEIDLSAYLWKPIGYDSSHYFSGTFNGNNQTITGMTVNETNAGTNGVGLFGCAIGMIRDLTVTNSTVVSDGYHTGGIVGYLDSTTLLNCSYSGTVTGFAIVGGLVGTPNNSNVHKCTNYATVTVTGTDGNAGGIAGDSMGYINNCANFGEIKGPNNIGGIAGRISYGSVKNSYNAGAVSATNGDYVGGIAAYVNPPSIYGTNVENCYYLDSTATAGLYSAHVDLKARVFSKTADVFKSGEVAWLLNGSVDGGSNWYQNLDNGKAKDDYPVLLSTNGKVYQFITYAQCDKGDTNPVITYSNSDTSDVVPAHVYQYKATDNVITETCENCESHTEMATIIIDPSLDLVYTPDTEHKPATVEYSDGWQGDTLTVTYENNINAGKDTAKASIEKDGEIASVTFSIKQAAATVTTAPAAKQNLVYNKDLQALITAGTANGGELQYSLDGVDYSTALPEATTAGTYTVYYKVVADSNHYGTEAEILIVTIGKATYDMSNAKWNYTVAFDYDGKPHTVEVDQTSLPEGVTIPYGAYTGNLGLFVGKYTAKVISFNYDSVNYNEPVLPDLNWEIINEWEPTEYTVSALNDEGWTNQDFIITPANGYLISTDNTHNGPWVDRLTYSEDTADGRVTFYLRKVADDTISLEKTVTYKLDKADPTGRVEFDERNGWETFLNTITFDLFFKDEVTVKVITDNDLSDIAKIEYASSDKAMTLDDVKAINDWTAMPTNGIGVTVEDTKQFVYFVCITDNAGNVTYLSTDGAEYDTTAPVISGVENGETYYTTQKVTVTDKNIESITMNDVAADTDITLVGNKEATYTIIATDKAGNSTTVTVMMKPIKELAKATEGLGSENVTSDHAPALKKLVEKLDELIADPDTSEGGEKETLEQHKNIAEDLLKAIEDAAKALDTENTEKVKDVTAENVTPEDKTDLEKAKEDLEKALEDNGGNYTEDENKAIEDEIKRIIDALEVIGNVEAVEELIDKLPDTIKKDDEAAIKAADDAYNALTDYEKSLVDKDAKKALDDAKAALAELNKPADPNSPATGDNSNMFLWIALLFISGGAVITLTVVDRKRKAKEN